MSRPSLLGALGVFAALARTRASTFRGISFILIALTLTTGCVHRVVKVTSDPPGALVTMNDQEIGRTPLEKEFTWYGYYDVQVRADGYETIKTGAQVPAPWWQWIPLDLITDMFPIRDEHALHYTLKPTTKPNLNELVEEGQQMSQKLESGPRTKWIVTSQPTTEPAASQSGAK